MGMRDILSIIGGWYKSIHEMWKVHIRVYKPIPCLKQSSGHGNPQAQSHNIMQMIWI